MGLARDFMKAPITIDKGAKISDAITELLHSGISRVVVTSEERPVGIVTEKDLAIFLLEDKTERLIDEIPLSEAMKKLVSVDGAASARDCAKTMLDKKISSLFVKSSGSKDGIITKTDLARYYADNFTGRAKVEDFMTTRYSWKDADEPLYKVVRHMVDRKISRIILKGEGGMPEGIMTFRDLFMLALDQGIKKVVEDKRPNISLKVFRKGFLSDTGFGKVTPARDIMRKNIISVHYDDDLGKACRLLLEKKINGAGVLSEKEDLIGIVSKTDVTEAVAKLDRGAK